ncbi:TP53-binding protein 1 isoform X2 [Labeo rohita]|uniref:TP53-binding protein 1 isoform X2 n=1 Tax=Labeo rohita TaxID=84645 RepID=UPI0021E2F9F2|nr:TP53-binding protein 1 isoform X2 [Labeo rohita]
MDPGESDLDSSFPQTENPCLIVEDSQPDSVALEDDPDTSYCALLARRLSNLQPTSQSPVLELISSPTKSRCLQSDSQTDKSDNTAHSDNLQSNLGSAATEHSQVFEVHSYPVSKRSDTEHMESEANSTTHCTETHEEMSQFGLLELSESQGVFEEDEQDGAPANQTDSQKPASQCELKSSERTSSNQDGNSTGSEVSSSCALKPQDGESRKLSIQAILHSQLTDSQEDEEDVLVSSQDDMFEKERNGTKADSSVSELDKEHLPTSTPAQSLRLLHLSGQGTLVQESLSQQSVDFVAATQDNLSQTPYIVPNSPTEKEQNYNEAAESPMDTSAPPEDLPPGREEEPMDMDPCPKPQPIASTPVSQNSPGFVLEKSLSVPSQPEFSHDVFVSTPSLEPRNNSQGTESSKKLPNQNNPSAIESGSAKQTSPEEQLKKPSSSGLQPSEVAECFQLELNSENSSFAQRTQLFIVEEDSQATQIVEEEGTVGVEKSNSSPKHHSQNASKNDMDPEPVTTSNSKSVSKVPDSTEKAEDCNPSQKLSQGVNANVGKQNITASPGPTPSQLSVGADCVSDTPNAPQTSKTTVADCSRASPSGDRPVPQQSLSQSVLTVSSQKNTEKEKESVSQSQRLSQPLTHSHSIVTASVRNAEEEERMDEGEIKSTVTGDDTGIKLGLSQSEVLSPEPMEEENGEEEKEKETSQGEPSRDEHSSSKEESFSVMVLEESQRISQEKVKDDGRSQPFVSSSQPVRGSVQDKREPTAKISVSQPVGSTEVSPLQLERTKSQSTQPSDAGQHKKNSDNAANRSLSDSSGELPFHFTLPKEGELIRPAVSATPPQISQLKKTPRHSTPIEMTSFSEPSEADVTRETTMAASEISVEESREGEEPAAVEQDGKLSLRMKLVTPVEEGSSGSEHFSLQKPPLTDEEGSVSKATTVAMDVTSPSVFSRVREAHRQVQVEDDEESSDPPLRQASQLFRSPNTNDSGLSPNCPKETAEGRASDRVTEAVFLHPGDTEANSEPLVSGLSSPAREQEAPSTSDKPRTPIRQRAVSQQTSVDISSTTSPPSKRAVSQQTSFDLSGPHNLSGRGEPSTPTRTHPGPSLRRHVRTIQEVRTTVTRIITDVYYEDGREVDRKVTHESEEPVVDRCVVDNDISPSRTGSSMTSGDLADVSSLSSKAPSHHSSSGTSSGGLGPIRMPDFLMPPSRGAKSGRGGRTGQRGGAHSQGASSSEEEHFAQRHVEAPGSPVEPSATSRSDSLNTTSPDNSAGSSSFVGLRVLAKWSSNSYFYSGSITRDLGENRFRLLFDDNQECEVQGKDILLCDPIPLETEVTALTEEEYFNIGVVKGHKTQGSEFLYSVEKDGQSNWYSRTSVILSMEQGSRLREQYGLGPYEPSTPQTMASDISLDNLVEGKRRRRGNSSGPGTPTRSSINSPRNPGPSGKRKLIGGTEEERTPPKRGRRGGGARVGQRIAACNTSGSGADLPPDPNDLVATHGPLPENTSLFMGFVFMLTASSENDRDSNHQPSDEDEEYVQRAPYNKHYTVRQLEAGGGMILLDFNEEQCKAAYQSLLIADQHCRTRKYLLCVAGGVPCVSQMWVRDCCQEKKLLNYRNYLLPAGLGPEGRIVEWHPRCNPFKALKVVLISEDRVDLWTSLLSMGGAAKVHHHKENEDLSDIPNKKFDLAVTSSACPSEELKRVAPDMPVVSLEWLLQSLICGKCLSYDSNSEFCHNPST